MDKVSELPAHVTGKLVVIWKLGGEMSTIPKANVCVATQPLLKLAVAVYVKFGVTVTESGFTV